MPKAKRSRPDACSLLDVDHRNVKKLFGQYHELAKSRTAARKKQDLAIRICKELTVHTQLEEEIFYPPVRKALRERDLLDEAEVEHATAKGLIAQIQDSAGQGNAIDAMVKVLGEYVDHHVKEERNELFPRARSSRLDLVGLRAQLATRKAELLAEHGIAPTA